jgi:hypothetical protein
MSKEKMATVDVQSQVARFYHTMNEVIHHTKNKFCKDVAVELLPYNGKHFELKRSVSPIDQICFDMKILFVFFELNMLIN